MLAMSTPTGVPQRMACVQWYTIYRAVITSGQPTVCIAVNTWLVACNELFSWYVVVMFAICSGLDKELVHLTRTVKLIDFVH